MLIRARNTMPDAAKQFAPSTFPLFLTNSSSPDEQGESREQ
jgi:hypothetical protein